MATLSSLLGSSFSGNQGTQGLSGGGQGTQGTSIQGPAGTFQGTQGLQGTQGSQGLQGVQGLQGGGTQGTQGIQGLQGRQGSQGLQSSQGTQGLSNQGIQGLQGPTGSGGGSSVNISDDTANATRYVGFTTATTGVATQIGVASTQLVFNPSTGNLGIGTTNPQYKLHVVGSFGATTKSFIIPHPTQNNKKLQYGSLESPYHGIRLTGKGTIVNGKCVVNLPKYICALVREEGINIQLTNIRHNQVLWVEEIDVENNRFTISTNNSSENYEFYWDFTAIRRDVNDLEVEF